MISSDDRRLFPIPRFSAFDYFDALRRGRSASQPAAQRRRLPIAISGVSRGPGSGNMTSLARAIDAKPHADCNEPADVTRTADCSSRSNVYRQVSLGLHASTTAALQIGLIDLP